MGLFRKLLESVVRRYDDLDATHGSSVTRRARDKEGPTAQHRRPFC